MRGARLEHPLNAPELCTARLLLRPHRVSDAAAWYALQSDPRVLEYLPWPPRSSRQSYRHLVHRTRHVRLEQADDFLALGIEHAGVLIGDVSLHLREVSEASRSAEIGWIVGSDWEGRGFAFEASSAMLELAFDRLGVTSVIAVMDSENTRSRQLARRLGFVDAAVEDGKRTMEVRRRVSAA